MAMHSTEAQAPDLTPLADCNQCAYRDTLLANEGCKPGDVCILAQSGRQIDRFLKRHPGLAGHYIADEFWERRAIAARYLPTNLLRPLLNDPDEAVRRVLAYRVPLDWLLELRQDSDREVRVTVADRLPETQLELMADDLDYLVRAYVAKRLPKGACSVWWPIRTPKCGASSPNVSPASAWADGGRQGDQHPPHRRPTHGDRGFSLAEPGPGLDRPL